VTGLRITADVKLVLVTGTPGAWKSTVTKSLYTNQTEEWRMLSLDDYFYLDGTGKSYADGWDRFEANAKVRGAILKYIGDRGGCVLAEGIIQTDQEVDAYRDSMGIPAGDQRFRFFDLRCARKTAAERMMARPVKEASQATWTLREYEGHYDYLAQKLRATGAVPIQTDGKTPTKVAAELVKAINAP
jgi:chloramphenicol 3-O-phosphotransferase